MHLVKIVSSIILILKLGDKYKFFFRHRRTMKISAVINEPVVNQLPRITAPSGAAAAAGDKAHIYEVLPRGPLISAADRKVTTIKACSIYNNNNSNNSRGKLFNELLSNVPLADADAAAAAVVIFRNGSAIVGSRGSCTATARVISGRPRASRDFFQIQGVLIYLSF